eukprot:1161564-Pelagomonas_calceolata.AAC.3
MLVNSTLPAVGGVASRAASCQQRLVLRKDAKPASKVSTQAIKEIFMPALSSTMTGATARTLISFSSETHASQLRALPAPPPAPYPCSSCFVHCRGQGGVLAEGRGRPRQQGRGALERQKVAGHPSSWTARCKQPGQKLSTHSLWILTLLFCTLMVMVMGWLLNG